MAEVTTRRRLNLVDRDLIAWALVGWIITTFGFTFVCQYLLHDMTWGWVWCGVCVAFVGLRVWLKPPGGRRQE
jgi:hypothetical protein